MNFLDLCTGWGRLIFDVALESQVEFQSYDGMDINLSCKKRFEELALMSLYCQMREFEVRFLEKNILDFKTEKKYALVTASWCLGFFKSHQIKKILSNITQMMDLDGFFILKEQISDGNLNIKGSDEYMMYSKQSYHSFFKEAYFHFEILYQ